MGTPRGKKKRYKKVGLAPGSVIYTGEKQSKQLFIEAFDYNGDQCYDKEFNNVEDIFKFKTSDSVSWINLNGLNHVNDIEKLGEHFNLHPLVLEDIVSISQRPKIDEYDDYLFIVLKMLYHDENETILSEQVSFVLGKNYVLSFQEAEGDVFDTVRNSIRLAKGKVRTMQADYLLYILMDAIVDNYFSIVENLSDKIEDYESRIFSGRVDKSINRDIQDLKREVLKVRRAIYPLREVISRIEKHESTLILKKTKTYYRDIYDHLIQVSENIDIYREMIWSLMDMYITTINTKTNEVMKVLTIMASIFIPLTFIVGVYGMNFDYMPELHYKHAYFILWGIMIALFIIMLVFFKRKKWL